MRIVWHGHSCFEVGEEVTVVVDPHDGKSIGIHAPSVKADLVLVSHEHFDHNCTRIVKGDFAIIREPCRKEIKGVKVLGVQGYHDNCHGQKRGKVTIFKFEMGGLRFCHLGDLGEPLTQEQVSQLRPVDVLFVPVGGVFTIDGEQAKRVVADLQPRVAIPMHFRFGGLSIAIQTAESFLRGLPEDQVVRVGNETEFTVEDLPSQTEYWVFSPD
jgi:L-ascorbate metabolism protein UlaG (beta-lactamase superfamily)